MHEYMHEWINEEAIFLFLPMLLQKLSLDILWFLTGIKQVEKNLVLLGVNQADEKEILR